MEQGELTSCLYFVSFITLNEGKWEQMVGFKKGDKSEGNEGEARRAEAL
jgi:hypothetical protein